MLKGGVGAMPKLHCQCHHCVTTRNVEGGGGGGAMPKLHCQCHHCVTTRNVEGGAEGGLCLSYTVSVTTVSPLEMLKGGLREGYA